MTSKEETVATYVKAAGTALTRRAKDVTVIFVVLKATDNINWSWWWVLSPVGYASLAYLVFIGLGALAVGFHHTRSDD